MSARDIASAILQQHASAFHVATNDTQRQRVIEMAALAVEPLLPRAEIVGDLILAGSGIQVRDEVLTGLFIEMTRDELQAIKNLPMYRRVTVSPIQP